MSSLYKMSGSYQVHLTASHWGEAYDELKHRMDQRASPEHKQPTPIRRREGHAPKSKSPTHH